MARRDASSRRESAGKITSVKQEVVEENQAEKLDDAAASGNSAYGSPMLSAVGGSMSPIHDMSLGAVLTPSESPQPLGADEKEIEAAKAGGAVGAAHKTAQPMDEAPSEPPASDASEAGDPSHPAPHCEHPEPQMVGNSRIGGAEWILRRKNEMQNRAYREGMTTRELQIAQVCKAVKRLDSKIPSESKMHFLLEIKKYLAGEVTPEAFAETIKCLVDQHGIVIPLNDTPIGGWVRPAGEGRPIKQPKGAKRGSSVLLKMAPGAKRAKGSDSSPIKGASPAARKLSPAVRKVKGKPSQEVIWDRKEGNSILQPADDTAWEALLSVCSDITA